MKIAPSILACDFANLATELRSIEIAGADLVHVDVMDNHFVPNLSFGLPVIQSIRPCTKLPFDVHLMTEQPDSFFEQLSKVPVQMISFHQEAIVHLDRTIHLLKEADIKAGIALNPGTPISVLEDVLPLLDFVLIMSVNPGFGGQKFISHSLDKIRRLKEWIKEKEMHVEIEVDGGVNSTNAPLLKEAGADILVAGTSVFGKEDRKLAIDSLR